MQATRMRRSVIGCVVVAVGLSLALVIAGTPRRGTAEPLERRPIEGTAYNDKGRAERGSREFPTPGTSIPTHVGGGSLGFGPGTESGGAHIEGLGTVSHANIDNNWARLEDQARTRYQVQ